MMTLEPRADKVAAARRRRSGFATAPVQQNRRGSKITDRGESGLRRQQREGDLPLDLCLVIGEEGCLHKQLLPQDFALRALSYSQAHDVPASPDLKSLPHHPIRVNGSTPCEVGKL
jgi:hypothetical protein